MINPAPQDWPFELPAFEAGTVWLVGMGPGDPGLLTLLAWHALREADLIVYDALVDTRILKLIPAGKDIVYAGKRGGRPSQKQADITEQLIQYAKEGRRVARLKGGDPFVFARGGEEARRLAEAGVPFRIVPGITAGIGGLAYAGIPATDRGTNASLAFVTGHSASGDVPAVDWAALGRGAETLVVYMPLGHLEEIARALIAAGRDPGEPAAILSQATTPGQTLLTTTLAEAPAAAKQAGAEPPSLFVVGRNVALAKTLAWWK